MYDRAHRIIQNYSFFRCISVFLMIIPTRDDITRYAGFLCLAAVLLDLWQNILYQTYILKYVFDALFVLIHVCVTILP